MEEYQSSMSELLTAIKWDQANRRVRQWNDPMEFLECLLENMQEDLEVSKSTILLLFLIISYKTKFAIVIVFSMSSTCFVT